MPADPRTSSTPQRVPAALPRLCVDIDNVIARSDDVMRAVIRDVTGGRVNLRREDIIDFKYQLCRDAAGQRISDDEWRVVHARFSDPDYLLSIEPCDGAAGWLARLSDRYSIHLATSRLRKARAGTISWLEQRGFTMPHDLHFLSRGQKHSVLGDFAAAIEDDLDQALSFALKPALPSTSPMQSFVMDRPWNRHSSPPPRLHRVRDWNDLGPRLLELADTLAAYD